MNQENTMHYESTLLQVPYETPDPYGAVAFPVYQTASYHFETAEEMEQVFCGQQPGYFYSRVSNPTVTHFEKRIGEVTGAASVTAFGSGMGAINALFMAIASSGANIVTTANLFGNTYALMKNVLNNFGVEVRFCDLNNRAALEAAVDANTCCLFVEIISNPQLEVVDLRALAGFTQAAHIPLVVDTTLVPFCSFKAKQWGIDIEVVSSTKYISGGGTSNGGLILDYATFNWQNSPVLKKWQQTFGNLAFTMRMKKEIGRNLGGYMAPQVASAQSLGLETMALRYEQQASSCLALAKHLQNHRRIARVGYPGLESDPFYTISSRQFGLYAGAMLTFDLESREACFAFLNRLKRIRRATNLFDNRSLILHPASTIYGTFTKQQREQMHVYDQTLRLSLGLESVNDLLADIHQALEP